MVANPEILNLFPISQKSARIAFGYFDENLKSSKRNLCMEIALTSIRDKNPQVLDFLMFRTWSRFRLLRHQDRLPDLDENEKEVLVSYRAGVLVGYRALMAEADERGGILPEVPKDVVYPWSHDTTKKQITDLQTLGTITPDPEIDRAIDLGSEEVPNLIIQKLELLDRLNKFGSGHVRAFFIDEPALNEMIDQYITDKNPLAGCIRLSAFARGIRDICSVFRAYHEVKILETKFGNP